MQYVGEVWRHVLHLMLQDTHLPWVVLKYVTLVHEHRLLEFSEYSLTVVSQVAHYVPLVQVAQLEWQSTQSPV